MRTRRSILTFLTGEAFAAVTVITGLLATPFLLRWLGEEKFGAFRVALDWCGYLSLFELGLSGALLALLAKPIGRNDIQAIRQTLAAALRAYLSAGAIMLIGGVCLASAITRLVPVSAANAPDLRRGCIVLLLGIAFVPLSPFRALAEARQRGYRINALLVLQSLLITGLALMLARVGWGITGQCLAVVIAGVAFRFAVMAQTVRDCPDIFAISIARAPAAAAWRGLWNLNWPTLVFNVCGRVSLLTDNIIVAGFLGPAMVVPFFLTQRLATLAQRELQGIGNASWAALAELYSRDELTTFNQRLLELTALVTLLGVACLVPLSVHNRRFMTLWVGPARYGGESLTIIASVNAIMLAVFSLWGWCVSGTGQIGEMTSAMVVQTVINFICSILLTRWFGMIGPLLGTLIAFLAVSMWYLPLLLRRLFGTSRRELAMAAAVPLSTALPYAIATEAVARAYPPSGWIALGTEIAVLGLCFAAASWLFILREDEKTLWRQRIRLSLSPTPG